MDTDKALKNLRTLHKALAEDYAKNPEGVAKEALVGAIYAFRDLDNWLSMAGTLPTAWQHPKLTEAMIDARLRQHSSCCLDNEADYQEVLAAVIGMLNG